MSRRNNNTLSPDVDSPSLLSDESTPDPSTYRRGLRRGGYNSRDYLDEESQQPNQIPDSFLDSLGRVVDDGLDSPTRDDEVDHETDDEVDQETDDDVDDGIGNNNLTTYKHFPDEALSLFRDEDQALILRKVEELKRLINAQGNEFTGVTVPTYDNPAQEHGGQLEAIAIAEEFYEVFFLNLMTQAGVAEICVFTTHDLKQLCRTKFGKMSADEKAMHEDHTKRFLAGSENFIKNQLKEKGETAFDDAPRYKSGSKHEGKIQMGTIKTFYLPDIFIEMSLNSIKKDNNKTLYMTQHKGDKIDITSGNWTGSIGFDDHLVEKKEELLEAAKKEKIEEEERKAREVENTARKMNELRAKVQALNSKLSAQKDSYEQQISRMQDTIDLLFAEKSELQKEHRASEKRIRELESQIQTLGQNQGVAGTNSAPNTYQHGNNITNNTTIIYNTPSKPKNED